MLNVDEARQPEIDEIVDLEDDHTWTCTQIFETFGVELTNESGEKIEYSWEEMGL